MLFVKFFIILGFSFLCSIKSLASTDKVVWDSLQEQAQALSDQEKKTLLEHVSKNVLLRCKTLDVCLSQNHRSMLQDFTAKLSRTSANDPIIAGLTAAPLKALDLFDENHVLQDKKTITISAQSGSELCDKASAALDSYGKIIELIPLMFYAWEVLPCWVTYKWSAQIYDVLNLFLQNALEFSQSFLSRASEAAQSQWLIRCKESLFVAHSLNTNAGKHLIPENGLQFALNSMHMTQEKAVLEGYAGKIQEFNGVYVLEKKLTRILQEGAHPILAQHSPYVAWSRGFYMLKLLSHSDCAYRLQEPVHAAYSNTISGNLSRLTDTFDMLHMFLESPAVSSDLKLLIVKNSLIETQKREGMLRKMLEELKVADILSGITPLLEKCFPIEGSEDLKAYQKVVKEKLCIFKEINAKIMRNNAWMIVLANKEEIKWF